MSSKKLVTHVVMLESFTEEDIERLPYYCEFVIPNLLKDCKRDAEWFENAARNTKND